MTLTAYGMFALLCDSSWPLDVIWAPRNRLDGRIPSVPVSCCDLFKDDTDVTVAESRRIKGIIPTPRRNLIPGPDSVLLLYLGDGEPAGSA